MYPDLDCDGELSWAKVKPGATVMGNFTVQNIGEPDSQLNWVVLQWPEWGEWEFTPESGTNLHPEDGAITVIVHVTAPSEKSEFNGTIKIVNAQDPGDFDTIPVYMKTPVDLFSAKSQFLNLLQGFLQHFPVLRNFFRMIG